MKKSISIFAAIILVAGLAFYLIKSNGTPKIRNIILISIDTCRADYLSCYGYPQKTTPNIDAFAQTATRFENVISPVPITLPAHCSMLTGKIPPSHGVHNNTGYKLDRSNQTLAEILRQNGFKTAAFISSFVLDSKLGMAQGFDTYDDSIKDIRHNEHGNERRGDETTRIALDWLEKNKDDNSFLFLHYYDPHHEYAPPEPFASEFADNPYAGEIAFTDHCIGQVIQKLKELDLYDSTLLIITGDHGEMLGEHGEEKHSYFIYESAIKVPLIIKQPGQKEAVTITQPVGLVDIVPTLCSMLKIKSPSPIHGMDISPLMEGSVPDGYERFIYSESGTPCKIGATWLRAISTGRWKYIQAPRPEIYDLATDRKEANNLIEKEAHRARILEDKLMEKLELSIQKDLDNRIQMDSESLKRLQSLGYVAGETDEPLSFNKNLSDPKDLIPIFEKYKTARQLYDKKEYEKSKKIFETILLQWPENPRINSLLGAIALNQGQIDSAIGYFRSARRIDPSLPTDIAVCNDLAWLQATKTSLISRDFDEAVLLAKRACEQSNYSEPRTLDTLAVCYAAAGDFPKAVETARKAYKIAISARNTALALEIAERLKLFEQSIPYVETPAAKSGTANPRDFSQLNTSAGAACCPYWYATEIHHAAIRLNRFLLREQIFA